MFVRWDAWNDLFSTPGQAEQLLTHGSGHLPLPAPQLLPLDIRQSDDAFYVEAAIPGFGPDDVEITFDENVLTIRGVRPAEDHAEHGVYVQRELRHSSFHRHVHLPAQVRVDGITASFEKGMLTVMVPREQRAQPKRIPVTVRAEEPKLLEAPVPQTAPV